jgi:hypothetical protein
MRARWRKTCDIGAAKTIDGLLGVADEKETPASPRLALVVEQAHQVALAARWCPEIRRPAGRPLSCLPARCARGRWVRKQVERFLPPGLQSRACVRSRLAGAIVPARQRRTAAAPRRQAVRRAVVSSAGSAPLSSGASASCRSRSRSLLNLLLGWGRRLPQFAALPAIAFEKSAQARPALRHKRVEPSRAPSQGGFQLLRKARQQSATGRQPACRPRVHGLQRCGHRTVCASS